MRRSRKRGSGCESDGGECARAKCVRACVRACAHGRASGRRRTCERRGSPDWKFMWTPACVAWIDQSQIARGEPPTVKGPRDGRHRSASHTTAMASARAMKRAQGDPLLAAAQSAFGGGSDVSDESSSEDEGARASSKPLNAFALLGGDDDDDDDTPEESEEEPEPPPVVKEPTPPPASKKKKKKKKKKTKDDDADEAEADDDDDDDGMAEITAALKEIGETMPAPRPERDALSADASVSGRDALMCVDTRRLKAEDELRSIFGASVIRAVETEDGGTTPTPTRWATSGVTRARPGKEGRCRPSSRTRGPCWSRPRTGGRRTGPKAPASRWSASTRRDSSRLFGSFAPTTSQTPTPRINERWRRTTRTTCTTPAVLAVARRRARGALRRVPLRR